MDALRPGHAHRSSSDRLLSNYLESQKHLTTSLLTLLSHSHSSTSSFLAYVTSSPGVSPPIRRAVRHSAFEGPLTTVHDANSSQAGSISGLGDTGTPGWAAYIGSLEQFRKDLKQIHLLEEEISRVKRDREILVTRLIKTTKSRPTRNDIKDIATSYSNGRESVLSSQASTYSLNSDISAGAVGKESKRAGKLAEAQAELLGCEEHLRGLEVRIEEERNNVMYRGLEERFHAMEVVGQMWTAQARKGMDDLERITAGELPPNAYELDSNGSLAPSQSASQVGYKDVSVPSPKRSNFHRHPHVPLPPGSISGSIAEEDEDGSSGDDIPRNLVMHENRPGGGTTRSTATAPPMANGVASRTSPAKPSPLGLPSARSNPRQRGVSAYEVDSDNSDELNAEPATFRGRSSGGRRAASDVGAMASRLPIGRAPLTRTFSAQGTTRRVGGGSDLGSIRGKKKRGGFFRTIARIFGGGSSRRSIASGRESPPYGSSAVGGGWQTRTDANIKRASTMQSRRGGRNRGANESSSEDEDVRNLVSVSNNRNSTWTVESVGLIPNAPKRSMSSATAKKKTAMGMTGARSDLSIGMKSSASVSTITGRTPAAVARATSPAMSGTKTPTRAPMATGSISRSNTVRSTTSVSTAKSAGTRPKSTALPGKKTLGSAAAGLQQAAEGRNIMTLFDQQPKMPEVAKAPKSTVTPQMELAKAPGSSIVPRESTPTSLILPSQLAAGQLAPADEIHPNQSISRSNSFRTKPTGTGGNSVGNTSIQGAELKRTVSPLPPSKSLSPPLKSAMRPTSPLPPQLSPPIDFPIAMYSVTAPGPVKLPTERSPPPINIPTAAASAASPKEGQAPLDGARPAHSKRQSYHSVNTTGDEASVYESAMEEGGVASGYGHDDDDDSSDEDVTQLQGYSVVENDRIAKRNEIATVAGKMVPDDDNDAASDHTATRKSPIVESAAALNSVGEKSHPVPSSLNATLSDAGSKVSRRKSVRMNVPDSINASLQNVTPTLGAPAQAGNTVVHSSSAGELEDNANAEVQTPPRDASPPPSRPTDANWDTRIGRVREDSSDEDVPRDDGYAKAKRGLLRHSGKWEYSHDGAKGSGTGNGGKKAKKSSTGAGSKTNGSVKTKGSVKG